MAALTKALNPVFKVGKRGVKNWNFGMKGVSQRADTLSDVIPMAKRNFITIRGKRYMKGADGKWYLK